MILLFINMTAETLGLITCISNLDGKAFFTSQYILQKYCDVKDIIFSYTRNLNNCLGNY